MRIDLSGFINSLTRDINGLIWPRRCCFCNQRMAESEKTLCQSCWQDLLSTGYEYCRRCGAAVSRYGQQNSGCPACIESEFAYDGVAICGLYDGVLKGMIRGFKFNDREDMADVLCFLLESAFQGSDFADKIDMLVPVPLHWTRRLSRGFNQSAILARKISKELPVSSDLVRTRRTRAQSVMTSFKKRAANVAGAFAIRSGHNFKGKNICLVDDIKTSGATLHECAKSLKQAGAAKVFALVLSRAGQV